MLVVFLGRCAVLAIRCDRDVLVILVRGSGLCPDYTLGEAARDIDVLPFNGDLRYFLLDVELNCRLLL